MAVKNQCAAAELENLLCWLGGVWLRKIKKGKHGKGAFIAFSSDSSSGKLRALCAA